MTCLPFATTSRRASGHCHSSVTPLTPGCCMKSNSLLFTLQQRNSCTHKIMRSILTPCQIQGSSISRQNTAPINSLCSHQVFLQNKVKVTCKTAKRFGKKRSYSTPSYCACHSSATNCLPSISNQPDIGFCVGACIVP